MGNPEGFLCERKIRRVGEGSSETAGGPGYTKGNNLHIRCSGGGEFFFVLGHRR
jgi:hypothetical protein